MITSVALYTKRKHYIILMDNFNTRKEKNLLQEDLEEGKEMRWGEMLVNFLDTM